MKSRPVRIILAFYPLEEEPIDRVWKSLKSIADICIAQPGGKGLPAACRIYEKLRLEGEALVIAQTQPVNVESVVNTLQSAGSPAIFVVRPESSEAQEMPADDSLQESDPKGLTRRAILARLQWYK